MGASLHISELDTQILARGWTDWILFGEVEQLIREDGSHAPREDSIHWGVRYCDEGLIEPANYHNGNGYLIWEERGHELELKIRHGLTPTPIDPRDTYLYILFKLTTTGRSLIPKELQF